MCIILNMSSWHLELYHVTVTDRSCCGLREFQECPVMEEDLE